MKPDTLPLLRCVGCRGELSVLSRRAVSPAGRLRDGLLSCRSCGSVFPVLHWIPRLLPPEDLTAPERAALESWTRRSAVPALSFSASDAPLEAGAAPAPMDPGEADIVAEERLEPDQLQQVMEDRVRSKLVFEDAPEKLRARAEKDCAYRVHHAEDKGKFVRTSERFLSAPPRRILDVGGGQGGTLTAFRIRFHPELALLLDLDPEWVELAWMRDPQTEVIRADATRMPLADGCIDFLFSTATLEHIPDWRRAVAEAVRVSGEGLLCYNPNGAFPYDPGHLDAPFVTWTPRGLAAWIALAWHRLRRTGRSLDSIRSELAVTHYVARTSVARALRRLGAEVRNAFPEFVNQTIRDEYHLRAAGLLQLLRRHSGLRRFLTGLFVWTGTEPNVYLFYRRGDGAPGPRA